MKNLILSICLTLINYSFAQVGINTSSPTKDLDINGELRIRTTPAIASSKTLAVDSNGNVGVSNNYILYDIVNVDATNPITYTLPNTTVQTKNNIDLAMSQAVTIPANKTAKIVVSYSIPAGISSSPPSTIDGYLGIRFLKNGIEAPEGSRKFSIADYSGTSTFAMSSISANYTETIVTGASATTVTYSLNGYVEYYGHAIQGVPTIKFNMWQAADPNYNWGRGTLIVQVFIKD